MNYSEEPSAFDAIEFATYDPLLEIETEFANCTDLLKLNLTIGAYRDENLSPKVFQSVIDAEKKNFSDENFHFSRAYLNPTGDDEFNSLAAYTIFPKGHDVYKQERILTIQSIAGTGCTRLGSEFLCKFISKSIAVPHLTIAHHSLIFQNAGLSIIPFRYLNFERNLLDIQGLLEDLDSLPEGSIVSLQVCCQNPTGIDPSLDEWNQIASVMKKKNLFPFFDISYQGYKSGDIYEDSFPVHLFYERGFEMLISASFSHLMGLYGERVGALHFIVNDPLTKDTIRNNCENIALGLFLTPLGHGARIVKAILSDDELILQWQKEIKDRCDRLKTIRGILYDSLINLNVPGSWDHINHQNGLFCFTGLKEKQVAILKSKYKIFLFKHGGLALSALNESNIASVAASFRDALTVSENN